jgi:FSR family fosmidomycin resistance protein-like MFS transporter
MSAEAEIKTVAATAASRHAAVAGPAYLVLIGISVSHLLNDLMQSLLPAIYPILKTTYQLDFTQIGLITLANQVTASLLQPGVGFATDRRPLPYSLALGMTVTLVGIVLLSTAEVYGLILLAAALIGVGSSVFHPESSRVARLASGGRHGFAQSLFQVGGNLGAAIGPLLAALIVVPFGQRAIAWFAIVALIGITVLWRVGTWYKPRIIKRAQAVAAAIDGPTRNQVVFGVTILVILMISKHVYTASLSSYYAFYLIHKFGVSTQAAQIYLFILLGSIAAGTFLGGPIGDRFGRKHVILFSIIGALPFTLALPHVDLFWTAILSILIGFITSSAFPAIVVYGQELMPQRIGMVSGIFFGLAFGIGGLGAAMLGKLADLHGIEFVYQLTAFLPAFGLFAILLPNVRPRAVRIG